MVDRDAAAKRLALEFANARSDKELPPPYDTLEECPDAAHFLELAELSFDLAVVPALTAHGLHCPGCNGDDCPNDEIPWSAVCAEEKLTDRPRCVHFRMGPEKLPSAEIARLADAFESVQAIHHAPRHHLMLLASIAFAFDGLLPKDRAHELIVRACLKAWSHPMGYEPGLSTWVTLAIAKAQAIAIELTEEPS